MAVPRQLGWAVVALAATVTTVHAQQQWPDWMPPVSREQRGAQTGTGWGTWQRGPGCQTFRDQILAQTSEGKVGLSSDGCRVVKGRWYDAYTGAPIQDAQKAVVEHLVAPREADESGAWRWGEDRKNTFFNDTRNLAVVSVEQSREKDGRDPARWLPVDASIRCEYVRRWLQVKWTYKLTVDYVEARALVTTMAACAEASRQ